jgi:glutamate synthase (ferredoxin)
VGARLGAELARRCVPGHPVPAVQVTFGGAAGQSFGAFLSDGVRFELVGEANDYVGKGMGGGRIVIRPPDDDRGDPVLGGNTLLYGATGGELFVAGRVGERLAVRNSGAVAVVEGAGHYACEYMTGGTVVILGPVGHGIGAGMSAGEVFVWDPEGLVPSKLASGAVLARRPTAEQSGRLRALVERHAALTGSDVGATLLARWHLASDDFWRLAPGVGVVRGPAGDAGPDTSDGARSTLAVRAPAG